MTRLRGYRQNVEKIGFYRGQKLGYVFPRLYDITEGEILANAFLQVRIQKVKFEETLKIVNEMNLNEILEKLI